MNQLLNLVDYLKRRPFLQVFTIYLRYLIGAAFVIAAFGMGKFSNHAIGISSTAVPIEKLMPLQQFFRVMADSGLYWNFIGLSQVIGGLLLMTQRFSKAGALIFFGIILNIFVITVSYNFQGTPVVTGLMLLATTYLLVWDLDSFQFIFRKPTVDKVFKSSRLAVADNSFWSYVGVFMFSSILALVFANFNIVYQLGACFVEGLLAFIIFFAVVNRRVAAPVQH